MNASVLTAVFKRNFFSYFANPTGYVFICVFVFLSAVAAFWPDEFFNANLANLEQLNKYFPFIMLFFVPAITMSIWAEETRQGTDELLLTLPASDFDVVLGKYLAAISIYTVALLISLASNFVVLSQLGRPDAGLYLCTHVGYWFLGLAMLAVGMVASFLTRNLTVAYILGALFNAPLVLMARIDIIPGLTHTVAAAVRQWSLGGQCQEFGRGMLGLSGILYFVSIAGIMLYVCMVLIGRRNWARGAEAAAQSGHFLVRALALAIIAVAVVVAVRNHDQRLDTTSEQLSSLSPYTIHLIKDLKADYVQAVKLQPQIARLEEAVKKQEESQKKQAAAASKSSGDKAADAKPQATASGKAAAKADENKADENKADENKADENKADDKKADDKKADEAKADDKKPDDKKKADEAKPDDKKPDDKKPDDKKADDKKADEVKADEKKAGEKKPETKAVVPAAPLSEDAKKLASLRETFDKLKVQGPVRIDAFISADVPESYVQTRINLLSVLRELKAEGGNMVELPSEIGDMQRADSLAEVAKNRFNIEPQEVGEFRNGVFKRDKIFMGVAFTCGLEKVVVPFLYRGMSAEYEILRSLCTVTGQKRKRVGILETDANVFGSFTPRGPSPAWRLVDELKKQYEVVEVSPAELAASRKPGEAEKRYDVLLAIQPSGIGPQEMENFVAAVRAGQPTLIFEDPFFLTMGIPGTYQPRQPQSMFGSYGPENREKGNIRALWQLLNIDFSDGGSGDEYSPVAGMPPSRETGRIVWQRYNPLPRFRDLPPELVFIDHACGAKDPFCEDRPDPDPISSKLQYMYFPGPGFIEDTPEIVKRLIAKWYNRQHAKQLKKQSDELEKQLDALSKKLDRAETKEDEDRLIDLVGQWSDVQQELSQVSSGGEDEKTIRPDQIDDHATFKSLLKKLGLAAGADGVAEAELRDELQNRFPARAGGEGLSAAEAARIKGETVRLEGMLFKAASVADAVEYAKAVVDLQMKDRKFVPLVQSASKSAGTVPVGRMLNPLEGYESRSGGLSPFRSLFYQPSEKQQYVLAAHIQGTPCGASVPINVVLAADADMVGNQFFEWREQRGDPEQDIDINFDNITFALNALDVLAGDDRFLEIRKRRPQHRTLEGFDAHTRAAREESARAGEQQRKEHDDGIKNAVKEVEAKRKETSLRGMRQGLGMLEREQMVENEVENVRRKQQDKERENHETYEEEIRKINDALDAKILNMQKKYKLWAVIIPPIPPLLVAGIVFLNRRAKEREGVSKKRLR
jgi:hypothetical protein